MEKRCRTAPASLSAVSCVSWYKFYYCSGGICASEESQKSSCAMYSDRVMPLVKAEGEPRLWDQKGLSINCMTDFYMDQKMQKRLPLVLKRKRKIKWEQNQYGCMPQEQHIKSSKDNIGNALDQRGGKACNYGTKSSIPFSRQCQFQKVLYPYEYKLGLN